MVSNSRWRSSIQNLSRPIKNLPESLSSQKMLITFRRSGKGDRHQTRTGEFGNSIHRLDFFEARANCVSLIGLIYLLWSLRVRQLKDIQVAQQAFSQQLIASARKRTPTYIRRIAQTSLARGSSSLRTIPYPCFAPERMRKARKNGVRRLKK